MNPAIRNRSNFLSLALVFAFAGVARADFNPIALTPGSFNADVVVENTALPPLSSATTASTDGGTNNNGNTWYEIGYNAAALATGLPFHGSTVTDTNGGNHHYTMAPSYTANCVMMVGHHSGAGTPVITNGTLTLTTPATYDHLSFLNSAGNGPVPVNYVIHYADSTTESGGPFSSRDWQVALTDTAANAAGVYNCGGRIVVSGGGFANVNGNPAARLFFSDIAVGNPAVNITSIDIVYAGNPYNNGRACIFAIAGSTDGGTVYNPIAVTGYNFDPVLEVGGPTNNAFAAGITTATMDGGTNNTGNTWYERSYYARFPNTGLPNSGSTFTSASRTNVQYTLASYSANNAAMLDSSNFTANVTPSVAAIYGGLSFLVSGVNTPTPLQCILQFQDGTSETNALATPDWFNNAPFAWASFGRVNRDNKSVNNTPDQVVNPPLDSRTIVASNPRLYDSIINVTHTSSAITNIFLVRTNVGGTQRSVVLAVSGAPVGNVIPVLASNPAGIKTWAVSNIVLSATVSAGTGPITYQWKKAPKGGGVNNVFDYSTFANVADGGNISGATTSTLTITNTSIANSGDYLVIASNPYGAATSSVATVTILSPFQNIPLAGDPVAVYQPNGGSSPAAQTVDHAIDRLTSKYLNYGFYNNTATAFGGPVGFTVTPSGLGSVVTSIRFYAADDTTGRDPSDYTLEGSNDAGATWIPITGGVLRGTLAMPTGRNAAGAALNPFTQNVQEVDFANAIGYQSYRVTFTNVYTPNNVNSMQIGEVELLGNLVPNPPAWTRQPVPAVTVFVGASPTFSAAVAGYPPPAFQWKTNGIVVPGATNSTYTFPNAQLADSGRTFSVTATNIFGTTNSTSATLTVIAAPTRSYPSTVLADGAIAYWRLNETPDDGSGNNGKVANDYRGGHAGQYSNAVLALPGYNAAADSDTAAQFGAPYTANSYVGDIQDVSFGSPTNTSAAFSVEAWVKAGPQSFDSGIVTKGTGGGGEQFDLDSSGANPRKFRFLVRDAAGTARVAQSTLYPDGNWHHLVGVCDQANGVVRLYVDGLVAATGAIPPLAGLLSTASPVTIGARRLSVLTDYNLQFDGIIDEVAIYNVALSAGQALNHYYAAQLPPVITLQPTNLTVAENVSITFYSSAYGSGTVSYRWYLSDGVNPTTAVPGQTSSNLTFTTTAAQNGNFYQLVVTNAYGAATGSVAQLSVVSGPPSFIANLPSSDTFYVGHVIQLSVDPGGTAPFTYQWQKNGVNISDNYRISGSHTNVLTIGYANFSDTGSYQVLVSNGQGNNVPSTLDTVTVTNVAPAMAFNASGTGWSLQGTPIMSANRLELSSGLGGATRSAFLTDKQTIAAFNASFIYQTVSGAGGADGVTFCIQNDTRGAAALGGGGGALAYSGITPSVALAMNIFANNTRGIRLLQNGTVTTPYAPIDPVLVGGNTNPIQVTIAYVGGVLSANFRDLVTNATFTTNFTVNIPAVVGDNTAYVGFTGADGGVVSTQIITNFTMLAAAPLTTLSAQKVGDSLVFSWPTSVGAVLRSSPSLSPGVWTDVTALFQVINNRAVVTVSPLAGTRFYRLDVYP